MTEGRTFGARVKRKEDPRLLRGDGRYVADIKLHGMAHAAFVRSPYAHARIGTIDTRAAEADPGVLAVLVGRDLPDVPTLPCIDAEEDTKPFNQPAIATQKVRYVGEPVAVVVAADRYEAEDALALVEVDFEPLPAVADAEAAAAETSPLLFEEFGTNVADVLRYDEGDVERALAEAPHVLRERFSTQRYAGMPMETRGAIAEWDEGRQALTLRSSTQIPNSVKRDLCAHLGLSEAQVRVIAPDIGGAFGVKLQTYPEEILLALVARRLRRPVKWIEDRWEHFVATTHGREQHADVEVAYADDGEILGLRAALLTNTGAYLQRLTLVEPFIGAAMLRGPYRIPNFAYSSAVVISNKTPMNPFRGVGHVQAAFVMERIVDMIARERGLDPAEVRLRNMLTPDDLPLPRGVANVLAGEVIYDCGDYPECLRRALAATGVEQFRAEQERLRAEGRYVGLGIGCFVEEVSLGPYESGSVRVEPSGKVVVLTGTCSSGQGHNTVFSQIAADELGVSMDDVIVLQGDTDVIRSGVGTYASRSAGVGGAAVRRAGRVLKEKILAVAEQLLEARAEDLRLEGGAVSVAGSPDRRLPLGEVAQAVAPGRPLPPGIDSYGLEATDIFHPETNAFAYATHVAVVEVDIDTGVVTPLRHIVVEDSGTLINPLLVDGQVQGGIALGLGGALLEEIVYDEDGQPQNASFMDYLIAGVDNMPEIVIEHMSIPTPLNPDGIKGVGEGGAVGSPAAIANAVADALSPFGVEITETPITPARVYRLLRDAGAGGRARGVAATRP
jgi:carbon-monoxide dehydrogenase large subunit